MKPQEVKPKAQTDWLGFRKGVRTYVQRASLMMPSQETATKATMSLHVTAEHMSSKFTLDFLYLLLNLLNQAIVRDYPIDILQKCYDLGIHIADHAFRVEENLCRAILQP